MKIFLQIVYCLAFMLFNAHLATAQKKYEQDSTAPYVQKGTIPTFELVLLDNTTISTNTIPKGKTTVFLLFSPDCDHCAKLAKEIKNSNEQFNNLNFWMMSPPVNLADIRTFADTNGIADRKDIHFAQDANFFFGSFYRAKTVPFLAIYNAKGNLVNAPTTIKDLAALRAAIQLAETKN